MQRPAEFYLGLWTLVFLAAAAFIVIAQPLAPVQQRRSILALRATEQEGKIRIDWEPANPVIRTAEGAMLEVQDGKAFFKYPVDRQSLTSGGLDYVRRSDEVVLTLTLYRSGQPNGQAVVRTVAPIEEPRAPVETRERPRSRSRRR